MLLTGLFSQQVPSSGHSASVLILSQKNASNIFTHLPLHCFVDGLGGFGIGLVVLYITLVVGGRDVVLRELFLLGIIRFGGALSP